MPPKLVKERNNTIEITRLFLALMIVVVHTHPFEEIMPAFSFFTRGVMNPVIPPFFLLVSGFYFFQKNIRKPPVLAYLFYKPPFFLYQMERYLPFNKFYFKLHYVRYELFKMA